MSRIRIRDQRGALTPAVIIMIVLLLPLGALVADAGKQINAKLKAQAIAQEAARAGATYIRDLASRQGKPTRQSKAQAEAAVQTYCEQAEREQSHADSQVTISRCEYAGAGVKRMPDETMQYYVEARVKLTVNSSLLGLLGINELTATDTAEAHAVTGVLGPGEDWWKQRYTPSVSYPPFTPPISTGNTSMPVTTITRPTEYPTTACGHTFTFPLTIAVSCVTTTTEVPTATVTSTPAQPSPTATGGTPPSNSPSPTSVTTTLTTPSPTTTWTLVPTSATPPGWGG